MLRQAPLLPALPALMLLCAARTSAQQPTARSDTCPVQLPQDPPSSQARSANARQMPRIVNGDLISDGLVPYMVSIFVPDGEYLSFDCTGTLVSSRWVLSAAHCDISTDHEVQLGSRQAGEDCTQCTWHSVTKVHAHPQYAEFNGYDIAVFQIDPPAPESAAFMKVSSNSNIPEVDSFVRVVGFGHRIFEDPNPDDVLRQVDVPVVSQNTCNAAYTDSIDYNLQVCAGYNDGGCDSWYVYFVRQRFSPSTHLSLLDDSDLSIGTSALRHPL